MQITVFSTHLSSLEGRKKIRKGIYTGKAVWYCHSCNANRKAVSHSVSFMGHVARGG